MVVKFDGKFANDILKGFTANPKYILNRNYYDKKGSVYFQQLMEHTYYYPTNAKMAIFENNKTDICNLRTTDPKEAHQTITS